MTAFNGTPGDAAQLRRAGALLQRCSYRLAHWRVAGEEINYRRFFDINGLAAHPGGGSRRSSRRPTPWCCDWLREGKVDGLRIDHPDGLLRSHGLLPRPAGALLPGARARPARGRLRPARPGPGFEALAPRLRARWRAEVERDPDSPLRKALYVVVEKIQGGRERIPEDWAVHGTTGYRFANVAGGLFVDPAAEAVLHPDVRALRGGRASTSRSWCTARSSSSCG